MAKRRKKKQAKRKQELPAIAWMSRREILLLGIVANILSILGYFGLTPARLFPLSAPSVAPPVALPPTLAVAVMPPGRALLANEVVRRRYTDHQIDQSMIALRSRIIQPSNLLTTVRPSALAVLGSELYPG